MNGKCIFHSMDMHRNCVHFQSIANHPLSFVFKEAFEMGIHLNCVVSQKSNKWLFDSSIGSHLQSLSASFCLIYGIYISLRCSFSHLAALIYSSLFKQSTSHIHKNYGTVCLFKWMCSVSVCNRNNWRRKCDALALQLVVTSSTCLPIILSRWATVAA